MMEIVVKAVEGGNDITVDDVGFIRLQQLEDGIAEHEIYIGSEEQLSRLFEAIREIAEEKGWDV